MPRDKDIPITKNLRLRVAEGCDLSTEKTLHLRMSEPHGGHGEADHLTRDEARQLRAYLDLFIGDSVTYIRGGALVFRETRMPLTFQRLQATNKPRAIGAFGHAPDLSDWSPLEWAGAAAGEMGELANLVKKLRRGEPVPKKAIADEIADTITYLDLLASALDIDTGEAVATKFNEVSDRKGWPGKL